MLEDTTILRDKPSCTLCGKTETLHDLNLTIPIPPTNIHDPNAPQETVARLKVCTSCLWLIGGKYAEPSTTDHA